MGAHPSRGPTFLWEESGAEEDEKAEDAAEDTAEDTAAGLGSPGEKRPASATAA